MQGEIIELANSYAAFIGKSLFREGNDQASLEDYRYGKTDAINLYNIESGLSGKILFLIELYNCTGEQKLLHSIEKGTEELIKYSASSKSGNWALFTGRAGIIYTLLHVARLKNDAGLVNQLAEWVLPCSQGFLRSEFVADGLYNGRAGTLLLLNQLYQLTGNKLLYDAMIQFINRIINNSQYSDAGLSWKIRDKICAKVPCGMANGSEGIKYVFNIIKNKAKEETLEFVVDRISMYLTDTWFADGCHWPDFEQGVSSSQEFSLYMDEWRNKRGAHHVPDGNLFYASGMSGVLLGNLANEARQAIPENAQLKFYAGLETSNLAAFPLDLYSGLAGAGLLLLQLPGNEACALLSTVVEHIHKRISTEKEIRDKDMHLMHGNIGAIYFLLKSLKATPANPENILSPFLDNRYRTAQTFQPVTLDMLELRHRLYAKIYYRSLGILDVVNTGHFSNYCNKFPVENRSGDIILFTRYLETVLDNMPRDTNYLLLSDAFQLERKKNEYFCREERNDLDFYFGKLIEREEALRLLNFPDDWILNCEAEVTGNFEILESTWNWSFYKDLELEKISSESGQPFEYLIFYSSEKEKNEIPLNIAGLVIHQFDHPKKIGKAIDEMKQLLKSLSLETLKNYAAVVGSSTVKNFIGRIDYLLLTFIKQMCYEGFIQINPALYETAV